MGITQHLFNLVKNDNITEEYQVEEYIDSRIRETLDNRAIKGNYFIIIQCILWLLLKIIISKEKTV